MKKCPCIIFSLIFLYKTCADRWHWCYLYGKHLPRWRRSLQSYKQYCQNQRQTGYSLPNPNQPPLNQWLHLNLDIYSVLIQGLVCCKIYFTASTSFKNQHIFWCKSIPLLRIGLVRLYWTSHLGFFWFSDSVTFIVDFQAKQSQWHLKTFFTYSQNMTAWVSFEIPWIF